MKWRKLSCGWVGDLGPQHMATDGKGRTWLITATRRRVGCGSRRRYETTYHVVAAYEGDPVWRNVANSLADAKRQVHALWS